MGHAGLGLCRKAPEIIEVKQGWEPSEGQGKEAKGQIEALLLRGRRGEECECG